MLVRQMYLTLFEFYKMLATRLKGACFACLCNFDLLTAKMTPINTRS
jgi:hypothetical protein